MAAADIDVVSRATALLGEPVGCANSIALMRAAQRLALRPGAGTAGVWLFYLQHQFEDVYWTRCEQWSYADAALRGSSHLKLPKVLQFFSGNIGLHHVHHLSARIPNYNLQRAHDENPIFQDVPVLTVRNGLCSTRLKLIHPQSGRLLTWSELGSTLRTPQAISDRRERRKAPAQPGGHPST